MMCCLTPLPYREDGRHACWCCGRTYSDNVTMSDRVADALARLDDRDDPSITRGGLRDLKAVRDRVLAEIAARPSVYTRPRRGRPPKVKEQVS